jgi:hypothetical protein
MGGGLAGLKGFLGFGGTGGIGAGLQGTLASGGASTLGMSLSKLGHSQAAMMGGAMLGMDGLRRGGLLGMAETTAGGALIGFKYGGPLGAAIGAGVGAVAGLVRMFIKGAEDKARQLIKSTYGVDMQDKAVLRQIVDMAKQNYGGNLEMTIRTQQARDLIELYALSHGQNATGLPARMTPTSFAQSGGNLFQQPTFYNGSAIGGGTTIVNVTVPGAKEFFQRETVTVIANNPRPVQAAAGKALKSSFGLREQTAMQLAPGTLTS